tara:strand:+ start:27 stop:1604 length:1578 start_codon:yes stop_codon:yes gene_type:complete
MYGYYYGTWSVNNFNYDYTISGPTMQGHANFNQSAPVGNNSVTFSGLSAGTYTITATSTLPHQVATATPCSTTFTHVVLDQTPIYGCTDPTANNYNSSATISASGVCQDPNDSNANTACCYNVDCYHCYGSNVSAVNNIDYATIPGSCDNAFNANVVPYFNHAYAVATYGEAPVGNPPVLTPTGLGCVLGCASPTAWNYNPSATNGHNMPCYYCDMTTSDTGTSITPGVVTTTNETAAAAGDGTVSITLDANVPYQSEGDYRVLLQMVDAFGVVTSNVQGWFTVASSYISGGASPHVTWTGQDDGDYRVVVEAANGCEWISPVVTVGTDIVGCMNAYATNKNQLANSGMWSGLPGWDTNNNNCNGGNPAPGHCCFSTTLVRCATQGTYTGYVESFTWTNQSNRGMPAGASAAGYKSYAEKQAMVASEQWECYQPGSTNCGCVAGCTYQGILSGGFYWGGACDYDPNATWQPASLSCPTSKASGYSCVMGIGGLGCNQVGQGSLQPCVAGQYTTYQDCLNNTTCTS